MKTIYTYEGFQVIIEELSCFDWGYIIAGFPHDRDNWGYLSSALALSAAQNEIDKICVAR